MKNSDLINLLRAAVDLMREEEPSLLDMEGLEQALVFRVGVYLQELLKKTELNDYNLDCEYNKQESDHKRDVEGNLMRPDLLIHRRGDNSEGSNKLAVEFKGWWNKKLSPDKRKLCDLTHSEGGYAYQLGVLVVLSRDEVEYNYFVGGEEVSLGALME